MLHKSLGVGTDEDKQNKTKKDTSNYFLFILFNS